MADQKISQLTEVTTPSNSDVLPIVNSGETKKVTLQNLLATNQLFAETGSYFSTTNDIQISGSLKVTQGQIIAPEGTGSFDSQNPEQLIVANSDSHNVAFFNGDNLTYAQINVKNNSNNSDASSDIVCTADNGNETTHYVNLGINSSGYEFRTESIGFQNDAYLFNVGQDMYVGCMEPSSPDHGHLHLFGEGNWSEPEINIMSGKTIGFNTLEVSNGYMYEFASGSVKMDYGLDVAGTVSSYNSHITSILHLSAVDPLPLSSVLGDIAVSGSNVYFHNGTTWNQLQMNSI